MNTSYKLKPCTGDGSRVKLLLVDYVDMRPIFSGSFAVRKYAGDWSESKAEICPRILMLTFLQRTNTFLSLEIFVNPAKYRFPLAIRC